MARFEAGHRVWTHNLFSIRIFSTVLAMLQSFFNRRGATFDFCGAKFWTLDLPVRGNETPMPAVMVLFVAASFQALHLFCDRVVSGETDWPVCTWWPISNTGYALPVIPLGRRWAYARTDEWADSGHSFSSSASENCIDLVGCIDLIPISSPELLD